MTSATKPVGVHMATADKVRTQRMFRANSHIVAGAPFRKQEAVDAEGYTMEKMIKVE